MEEDQFPLHTKVCVSKTTKNINVFRALTVLRILAVLFFFKYRLSNPLIDGFAIWLLAICCETLFTVNFLLYSMLKWRPVERQTYLDRLSSRYEKSGEGSALNPIDIFITTADPFKEPPLVTANTILSVLAVDYPVEKIACYVSDDSASPITFSMMVEVSKFAQKWVPFCKNFSIEPRAPVTFFSSEIDGSKEGSDSLYFQQWKILKEEYEGFKIRVNSLASSPEQAVKFAREYMPWSTHSPSDHPAIVQVLEIANTMGTEECQRVPRLVYVAREKRAGYKHQFKAGAMNALMRVSGILSNSPFVLNLDCDMYINDSKCLKHAMCFLMDPNLEQTVAFVQFPQVFDNVGTQDVYGNRLVFLYDILLKGVDGIQGPLYCGTGCFHRRRVLHGCKPGIVQEDDSETYEYYKSKLGSSHTLIQSALSGLGSEKMKYEMNSLLTEATDLCSCNYEKNTSWGMGIGWRYGSSTEDVLTGYTIHCLGWKSIYFWPIRPAFRGVAPVTPADRLAQRKRVAAGMVKILLSSISPLFYGYRGLMLLQRAAYLYTSIFYAGISVFIVLYATLHAVCLVSARSLTPKTSDPEWIWFVLVICFHHGMSFLEYRWADASFQEWWNQERFWFIVNSSSYLFGTVEALLKFIRIAETGFTVTPKSELTDETEKSATYAITDSPLFIPLASLVMLFLVAMVAAIVQVMKEGKQGFDCMFGELLCGSWSLMIMYPILHQLLTWPKGISTVPLSVMMPSVALITLFTVIVRTFLG
eukprot:Gb_30276 [translate_table: standard]